jgi:hypothetical protein
MDGSDQPRAVDLRLEARVAHPEHHAFHRLLVGAIGMVMHDSRHGSRMLWAARTIGSWQIADRAASHPGINEEIAVGTARAL